MWLVRKGCPADMDCASFSAVIASVSESFASWMMLSIMVMTEPEPELVLYSENLAGGGV